LHQNCEIDISSCDKYNVMDGGAPSRQGGDGGASTREAETKEAQQNKERKQKTHSSAIESFGTKKLETDINYKTDANKTTLDAPEATRFRE
jgi:hypothetical protein